MGLITGIAVIVTCIYVQTESCQCTTTHEHSLCYTRGVGPLSAYCTNPKISCQEGTINVTKITIWKQSATCTVLSTCENTCCDKTGGKMVNRTIDVGRICKKTACDFSNNIHELPQTGNGHYIVTIGYQCKGPGVSSTTAVTVSVILAIVVIVTTVVVVVLCFVVIRRRRKLVSNGDSDNDVAADFHLSNQKLPTALTDVGDYSDIPDADVNTYIDLVEVTELNAREITSKAETATCNGIAKHTDVKADEVGETTDVYHYIDHSMVTVGTGSTPDVNGNQSDTALNGLVPSCPTEYDVAGQVQRIIEGESYGINYDRLKHHARRNSDDEDIDVIRRQESTPIEDSTYSHVQHFADERSVEVDGIFKESATVEDSEKDDVTNLNGVTDKPPGKDEPHYFILSTTDKRSIEVGRKCDSCVTDEGNEMDGDTSLNGVIADPPGKDEPHYFILSTTDERSGKINGRYNSRGTSKGDEMGDDTDLDGVMADPPGKDEHHYFILSNTDASSREISGISNRKVTAKGDKKGDGTNLNGVIADSSGKDEHHYFILSATSK